MCVPGIRVCFNASISLLLIILQHYSEHTQAGRRYTAAAAAVVAATFKPLDDTIQYTLITCHN